MTFIGWAEIALVLALVAAAAFPLSRFIAALLKGERTFLSPVLGPVERGFYAVAGVDPARGMGWVEYATALLLMTAAHFLILYLMLRFQDMLPFNPAGVPGMSPKLALNTAMSFVTNTNWQVYVPESQISYGSQMWGLTVHNFLSAAAGIAAAGAVMRAFAGGGLKTLGNFWVDLTRITLYLLLPATIVGTVVLMIAGVPQTMASYADATTLEGAKQVIALGPVAFQEFIKIFGTNGGGFFNTNSAHPFENPTMFTDIVETWAEVVIPFALALTLGHMVGDKRQGRALFLTMGIIMVGFIAAAYAAEAMPNPLLAASHLVGGNMEGKEVRFGIPLSSLFSVTTTVTSDGAVVAMHDSFMPLAGLVQLFGMQLGEVVPGGVGSGLYGIVVYALLAVFVAGLMVGRTPEYLGKKVQAKEVKLAMLAVLILTVCILIGTATGLTSQAGLDSLSNAGPHGLSEMLYAWTSATANNGSAFAGISGDTRLLDWGLSIAMLLGRFAFMVPVLAIAGSLAAKPKLNASAGTFPTDGPLFIGLLIGVILILGGLQFLPVLSLGPIAEHFAMMAGKTF